MALTNPIPLMHLWGRWVGPAEKPVPGVAAGTSSVRFTMSPSCLGQGGGQPPSWLVQGGGSAGPLLAQNPAKPRTGVDAPFRGFSVYAAQTSAPNTSSLGFSKIPEAPRRKFTFNRMISYCPDHSGFPSPPPRTHRRARPQTDEVAGVGHHRRSEEHTSELQSRGHLVCRLLLEKKKQKTSSRLIKEDEAYHNKNVEQ